MAGTETLHVEIKDVMVDMDITGGISFLNVIPLNLKSVQLSGLMLDLVLLQSSDDDVHWALQDKAEMSFDDIKITMENTYVNSMVQWLNWAIKYFIKSQE